MERALSCGLFSPEAHSANTNCLSGCGITRERNAVRRQCFVAHQRGYDQGGDPAHLRTIYLMALAPLQLL